jgi:hypothetical protein
MADGNNASDSEEEFNKKRRWTKRRRNLRDAAEDVDKLLEIHEYNKKRQLVASSEEPVSQKRDIVHENAQFATDDNQQVSGVHNIKICIGCLISGSFFTQVDDSSDLHTTTSSGIRQSHIDNTVVTSILFLLMYICW